MLLRVQHVMRNAEALQHARNGFADFNACRTYKHRSALIAHRLDLFDHRVVLLALRAIDHVVVIGANDRLVRRHNDDIELVNFEKLTSLGFGSSGHTGKLAIETEIIL